MEPSSHRRGGPISKHVSGFGTNKNMVMGPDGARNQLWLCWRGPAVIYPTDRENKFWGFFSGENLNYVLLGYMRLCSLVGDYQLFRGTYYFHSEVNYPEDGGSKFLRNVGKFLPDHTALHPRRLFMITIRESFFFAIVRQYTKTWESLAERENLRSYVLLTHRCLWPTLTTCHFRGLTSLLEAQRKFLCQPRWHTRRLRYTTSA
jgi:hypothetical protein